MKDNAQFIDFDFSNPLDIKCPEFINFVIRSYKGKAKVLIDSLRFTFSAFTETKIYIYNSATFLKKNRETILDVELYKSSKLKKNISGTIFFDEYNKRVKLGLFIKTDEFFQIIKNYLDLDTKIKNKMEVIVLDEWLDNVFAKLSVTAKKASIKYCFACEDKRYNPHFFEIDENDIDFYINCWKEGFEFYRKYKKKLRPTQFKEVRYSSGIIVRINMNDEGVSLDYWDVPITTEEELNGIIEDYERSKKRILELRQKIKEMAMKD